jgi:hypothetical protein
LANADQPPLHSDISKLASHHVLTNGNPKSSVFASHPPSGTHGFDANARHEAIGRQKEWYHALVHSIGVPGSGGSINTGVMTGVVPGFGNWPCETAIVAMLVIAIEPRMMFTVRIIELSFHGSIGRGRRSATVVVR